MRAFYILLPFAFFSAISNAFELSDPSLNDTSNLVWTGHLSPDSDSMTSAIIAAHIYGGVAAVPQPINPESKFILEYCKAASPKVVNDFSGKKVGLVDFNQKTQLQHGIDKTNIVVIVDHHAIGGQPIDLNEIISIDIRPWGSTATIFAEHADSLNIELPRSIACTTLAGILSDTVLFKSPITTSYDHYYAKKLAKQIGIDDLHDFGNKMLMVKSDLANISAVTILTMDYKIFEFAGKKVGIGVAETLNAAPVLQRKDEFSKAMKIYKKEQNLDYLFFSVTDTKNQQANLIWVDERDAKVIKHAFNKSAEMGWLKLPGVTSRKRQIGPAIKLAIEALN